MLDYNYDINITILKKPSKWAEELAGLYNSLRTILPIDPEIQQICDFCQSF